MAKQTLGLGSAANDNTGDTLRVGGDKINDNFNELYTALGNGSDLSIVTTNPASGQVLRYNGSTFLPSDYTNLTASLDVNGFSIVSASNGNIAIAPNGTGNVSISNGSITNTFNGSTGVVDFPTTIQYKNEYTALNNAPASGTYPGYFFTVDGDDNPYVNMNITAGGAGDVRAKVVTEYSSIDLLADVDTTTVAPTANQILKWNGTNWAPADDGGDGGGTTQNLFESVAADTGSTTANASNDTLTLTGGTDITTSITGDVVTINYTGTGITTLAGLSDTDLTGITQGNSLFYNGTDWIVVDSPITWWEINSSGTSDYTFAGPGFPVTVNDPTIYVHRGFTYAFDNSVQGGAHPFRIQSTQGLSGTPYTTGQSGSGTSVLYWTVPMDAPATLYYQCTIHALMNGTINVVN
ncbi:baseplate wedge tail fiber protein connector [Synechococcus phage S-MbCM100]|uniref:Baseplate wedge tail fiber connector n=2 Tax=Acionnavirus monteraybay TaxID=2734078 RepID=A0A0E3F8U9_9CAUD|nr:baseplate wedge tail fiber protein connector [Synechococcus phage S-MbCM100]AIX14263.1 baseplate wedge tail fiber connector [Synechococcus phage ACG-2014a]AHB80933.1 hypothetical protein S-MbCM100_083 [Synechococcus phage S-MbCM100]AIX15129.1 baseplate wedge tail fiber connector [Synechococcus phage ACG-2014a]AIX15774.1 baseplate wedge tail fiber connector [Synechococcus phage ACG-2014a]AIX16884.1 baseplate wedge tail fiber connector [Synechococcus phage ACG-2014a]